MPLPDWMIARDVKITDAQEAKERPGKISFGYSSYGYDARAGYKWKVFSPINCTEIDPKNKPEFEKALVTKDLTPVYHKYEKTKDGNMRERSVWTCSLCQKWTHFPDEDEQKCPSGPDNFIRIPPHSFVLGETIERFWIPRDVLCVVLGKSTYARCGLVVNVTPGEPEWEGSWTVEISNTTPIPARVYCGEGIMQCVFFRTDGYRELNTNEIRRWLEESGEYDLGFAAAVMKGATCDRSYADKAGKYANQNGLTLPKVDGETK